MIGANWRFCQVLARMYMHVAELAVKTTRWQPRCNPSWAQAGIHRNPATPKVTASVGDRRIMPAQPAGVAYTSRTRTRYARRREAEHALMWSRSQDRNRGSHR
jgi:hypothetical protein